MKQNQDKPEVSYNLECLNEKYGPLLTLEQLAKLLNRSKEGLRVSLASKSDFSVAVNAAKRKLGRRVYFSSYLIAQIMDEQF